MIEYSAIHLLDVWLTSCCTWWNCDYDCGILQLETTVAGYWRAFDQSSCLQVLQKVV